MIADAKEGVDSRVLWMSEQIEGDDYEAWGWVAEGRIGRPITIVTP
jgi:hypothetical protein